MQPPSSVRKVTFSYIVFALERADDTSKRLPLSFPANSHRSFHRHYITPLPCSRAERAQLPRSESHIICQALALIPTGAVEEFRHISTQPDLVPEDRGHAREVPGRLEFTVVDSALGEKEAVPANKTSDPSRSRQLSLIYQGVYAPDARFNAFADGVMVNMVAEMKRKRMDPLYFRVYDRGVVEHVSTQSTRGGRRDEPSAVSSSFADPSSDTAQSSSRSNNRRGRGSDRPPPLPIAAIKPHRRYKQRSCRRSLSRVANQPAFPLCKTRVSVRTNLKPSLNFPSIAELSKSLPTSFLPLLSPLFSPSSSFVVVLLI
ncbi:hypothetical protein C7M84_003562 [Penaeus vannamei]|uniref:Uncharacterized protein n=1 Tax=Penaeus vannamei TaxID=6689 RepID=A0A3R7PUW8_PENVA|nr:hypothetical protein C7M84_003562 [Penaeus vannamei]